MSAPKKAQVIPNTKFRNSYKFTIGFVEVARIGCQNFQMTDFWPPKFP